LRHKEISVLFSELNEMFEGPESKSFLDEGLKKTMKLAKVMGIAYSLQTVTTVIDGFMKHKLGVPIWMPEAWRNNDSFFYPILIHQYFDSCVVTFLNFFTSLFNYSTLIIINSYARYLRQKLQTMKDRKDLAAFVEMHLKLLK